MQRALQFLRKVTIILGHNRYKDHHKIPEGPICQSCGKEQEQGSRILRVGIKLHLTGL